MFFFTFKVFPLSSCKKMLAVQNWVIQKRRWTVSRVGAIDIQLPISFLKFFPFCFLSDRQNLSIWSTRFVKIFSISEGFIDLRRIFLDFRRFFRYIPKKNSRTSMIFESIFDFRNCFSILRNFYPFFEVAFDLRNFILDSRGLVRLFKAFFSIFRGFQWFSSIFFDHRKSFDFRGFFLSFFIIRWSEYELYRENIGIFNGAAWNW